MKARQQRTHYMGFSNRTQTSFNLQNTQQKRNHTTELFQKSFNKSKSQYYYPHNKVQPNSKTQVILPLSNQDKKSHSSQLNFNDAYKQSQKGHHYQFDTKRFTTNIKRQPSANNNNNNNKKSILQYNNYDYQNVFINPSPLNFNHKLNDGVKNIKMEFQQKNDINLHKLSQLKSTFLRNNQKRRNLKQYFEKYADQGTRLLKKAGFNKLIKDYGYDINENQINLMFKLNKVHENGIDRGNENIQNGYTFGNNNGGSNSGFKQSLNLEEFINLMTKQNIYFKTLKLPKNPTLPSQQKTYRFASADFQIFRNKFSKLKQAFKIYKDEPIDESKFQKVMKKLDINDLVIKQDQRLSIFRQFSSQEGKLNIQRLLGVIATQQHQRIQRSGKQLKVQNYDNFQQNIQTNQQFNFVKNNIKDPLGELLYPINIKRSSFNDYERHVNAAKNICNKLKTIKQSSGTNIASQLCEQSGKIKKQTLYKNIQKLLQKSGYNFNKHQYKSFLAYLDFDERSQISKDNLNKILFEQTEKQRVDRLDRRRRNYNYKSNSVNTDRLNEENGLDNNSRISEKQDNFTDKMRSKSSFGWNTVKKSYIAQQNLPQFKATTKFSAWPQRLYCHDLSLVQAKQTAGMGIPQIYRFQKDEKHSYGQQDKMKRQRTYQNKLRKNAQWQQVVSKRVQQNSQIQNYHNMEKNYNLRLIKQKYEQRCHNQGSKIGN